MAACLWGDGWLQAGATGCLGLRDSSVSWSRCWFCRVFPLWKCVRCVNFRFEHVPVVYHTWNNIDSPKWQTVFWPYRIQIGCLLFGFHLLWPWVRLLFMWSVWLEISLWSLEVRSRAACAWLCSCEGAGLQACSHPASWEAPVFFLTLTSQTPGEPGVETGHWPMWLLC